MEVKPLMSTQPQLDTSGCTADIATQRTQNTEQDEQDSKLYELLGKAQYEPLKDQLANLAAAKASGNFVFQVAASVQALSKCSELVTEQTMSEFKQKRETITSQVS